MTFFQILFQVPADVQLVHVAGQQIEVDESALTGESLPQKKSAGDESLSGGLVKVKKKKKRVFFFFPISLLISLSFVGWRSRGSRVAHRS